MLHKHVPVEKALPWRVSDVDLLPVLPAWCCHPGLLNFWAAIRPTLWPASKILC